MAPGIVCIGPQRLARSTGKAFATHYGRVASTTLWEAHGRFVSAMVGTGQWPVRPEPDAEPETAQRATLHSIATDLRAWFRIVLALSHRDVRSLLVGSGTAWYQTRTAQRRPNYLVIGGRPALPWRRGHTLPVIICISQPSTVDAQHDLALIDSL